MKGLLFLMIVSSLFVNFSVNKFGWLVVYKMEFPNPSELLDSRVYDLTIFITWGLLLVYHAATISLLFLTHKNYFSELLFCAPLLFIIFFLFFNALTIPLLFPFIIIWLIALTKNFKWKINFKPGIKILILGMVFLSIITGIELGGGFFSLFTVEFLIPYNVIKSGTYNLWDSILWTMVFLAHLGLISLVFLTKKYYFNQLLVWVPACFIGAFMVFNYLAFFLLIPLIIVWSIALPKLPTITER